MTRPEPIRAESFIVRHVSAHGVTFYLNRSGNWITSIYNAARYPSKEVAHRARQRSYKRRGDKIEIVEG